MNTDAPIAVASSRAGAGKTAVAGLLGLLGGRAEEKSSLDMTVAFEPGQDIVLVLGGDLLVDDFVVTYHWLRNLNRAPQPHGVVAVVICGTMADAERCLVKVIRNEFTGLFAVPVLELPHDPHLPEGRVYRETTVSFLYALARALHLPPPPVLPLAWDDFVASTETPPWSVEYRIETEGRRLPQRVVLAPGLVERKLRVVLAPSGTPVGLRTPSLHDVRPDHLRELTGSRAGTFTLVPLRHGTVTEPVVVG